MSEAARQYNRVRVWYRPMRARDDNEPHRVATSLELLFDLCFVVAVGQAGISLHHALTENHVVHGVFGFLFVFFAIWWAWFQFAWFASAYDTDDVPYRLAVLVQIAGGLVIAAGVSRAFDGDFGMVTLGYVVMRLAAVSQWLRAAAGDPERRATALRYAGGITVVQVYWVARLALPDGWLVPSLILGALGEMVVPIWAENARPTAWHPHHIAERYGLFTIIVLGETVIGATAAVKDGLEKAEHTGSLVGLAAAGLIIVFAMWWLYFDQPGHTRLTTLRRSMTWGYGHLFIFASAAAVGAGIEVAVDYDTHTTHLGALPAGMALTVPVAVFVFFVWLLQIGPGNECRPIAIGFPVTAVLVLGASFLPFPVHATAVLLAALVATVVIATHEHEIPA